MNQLWVRLSLAFAIVLIIAFFLTALIFNQSTSRGETPPPEVIAYFEALQSDRLLPQPLLALGIVSVMAILAGVVVSRTLAAPMSSLEEAANEIAQGDLTARVDPRGSQEMVAVGASFNAMAAQLEQEEALRRSLLSDVAHELRHPLHVLQGNLQAMQDGVYPTNDEEIERLLTQTQHLTVMVNDLYVLAQAETQRLPLHKQPVDIAGLVKEIVAGYQPLAQAQDIELLVQLLGTIPPVVILDKARIRQALQNLLDNALRHTPPQGRIRITVEKKAGSLAILITDNGQGIAPELLPQVFDRLYRGDQARRREGESTGLGLTISKAFVEAHGGTITAASPGVGQGSTFTILLPV